MATNFLINGSEFSDNFIPKKTFSTGGLWTWGDNNFGQLGNGTQTSRSSPAQITGNNWKEVPKGSSAAPSTAAFKTDGTLWTWGAASYGTTSGDGTSTDKSSPVQVTGTTWKQISTSLAHVAAIKSDGTLWTWGRNFINFGIYGRLGNGSGIADNISSPIQTASGGTNWKMVSTGQYHTSALKTDGTLWSWGYGQQGQLGLGSTGDVRTTPTQVGSATNWKIISTSNRIAFGIKTDNTLWSWGGGYQGGLGTGSTSDTGNPTQIGNNTTWKLISAGYYNGAAIKTDGTLWTWGYNYYGNLGDGTTANKSSPVQIFGGGTNWKEVSNGGNSCAAIKTDGTLWMWGGNSTGCLGDGTTANKSSPVQTLAGGNDWKKIYCSVWAGYGYMMAIRDDS
jgi:alpha-tubulin suppressor-like RCC1 family protein